VGKSVAAGGALAVRLCAPERAKVVFTMQVTTKTVVVTGKGKKQKRTTHVSVQRIPLGVTVRKTVVIKKGKQRSTKVQTSVRYMTSVTVQSDAHGRLSTSFRVKDTPKKAEQAVLSATTHWSGKPVVRTAHVTVQPLHQHKGKPKKSSSTHH
jgi:stress response protein SCP2